uniref:DUF1772 domain-containing protein n=1 Tax=Cyanothece sp. (strain PCC 7425 / ATCC 29141) TaxID=395961 RepID=B8HPR8_CYAP4
MGRKPEIGGPVMLIKLWRFVTLLLTALSMGLSFCHLLELPPRVFYFDAQLWITITTRGLYYLFGTVGAVLEIGSILAALGLAWLIRQRRVTFRLTLIGSGFLLLALLLWIMFIAPVNAELANWTPTAFPADWARYRNQWEYTHAINAIIKILGFSALIFSCW